MNNISIEQLDASVFSKFGNIVEKKNALELRSINQGTTTRYHNISELDLESKNGISSISIFSGTPRNLPIEIKIMEKHPVASQSFLPIQDYDWLIVVSEEKNELPDLNTLRCFHVNGDAGITYNKNIAFIFVIPLNPLTSIFDNDDINIILSPNDGSNLTNL